MKVAFHNLGCKVNSYETECMIKQFTDHGYILVPFNEIADVYIVNTCSVTSIADKKSRQMLHRVRKLAPSALVVAVGCYVQAHPECISDDSIDIAIGNDKKSDIYNLVNNRLNYIPDMNEIKEYDDMGISSTFVHTRAFIKIQDGCNQFCSYCLIPYLRGRTRSRDKESILKEAEELVRNGVKEIVLTGIHLSSYGTEYTDIKVGEPLLELISDISDIIGDGRIRLGSLEPRIITEDFAERIARSDKVCPHFHLSLQSGCNETLKRMNRHYTTEDYYRAVKLLRSVYEHPAITTDVIVGFPGESDEEFETTYDYLKELNLYEMHVFKYSLRKGTRAEKLPGHVKPEIMEERSNKLLDLSEKNKNEFIKYYETRKTSVLLEEEFVSDGTHFFTGYNPEYVKFNIPSKNNKIGDIVIIH